MDTLPLPPRPDIEQYRKRAKSLVKAAASDDDDAVRAWASDWLRTLGLLRRVKVSPVVQASFGRAVAEIERAVREAGRPLKLADAQFVIARAHGFESWSAFARHVEGVSGEGADPFETAVDAVVDGDLATLKALLRTDRALARARSAHEHRATLLHYVAANGVEDFRQRTPPNAVEIAETLLLEGGAAVDAVASTYGGGTAQTTLNLVVSSVHPAEAGLQPALVEVLLRGGAAVDGLEGDGSPLMTALTFGYLEAAEMLLRWGARVSNVMIAAAVGRTDTVRQMLAEGGNVAPSLVNLYWLELSSDPRSHVERAFVWACAFGRTEVVEVLLGQGVDPTATDPRGKSGLEWARAMGHSEIAERLAA